VKNYGAALPVIINYIITVMKNGLSIQIHAPIVELTQLIPIPIVMPIVMTMFGEIYAAVFFY